LTTAAAGRQRDAIVQNLNILRQGTGWPLAEVLSIPEVDKPLTHPDARVWANARALLDRNDLDGTLLFLFRAREAPPGSMVSEGAENSRKSPSAASSLT
jgi:hypothetical protein